MGLTLHISTNCYDQHAGQLTLYEQQLQMSQHSNGAQAHWQDCVQPAQPLKDYCCATSMK